MIGRANDNGPGPEGQDSARLRNTHLAARASVRQETGHGAREHLVRGWT